MNLSLVTRTVVIVLFLTISVLCFGQTSQTKYYRDERLRFEAPQEEAEFSLTRIQNTDGTMTTETLSIKKNQIIKSRTYKGAEPYGIWLLRSGERVITLNYNFPLIYSKEHCKPDSLFLKFDDIFKDNSKFGYIAPKINDTVSIFKYIGKNLVYPETAVRAGLEGMVKLTFSITKEGKVDNIIVAEGTEILLNKEAVRVIRELKFVSPPIVNGEPYAINCVAFPINFILR
jgi:TonB family protein